MTIHNSRLKFDLGEIANEILDRVDQSLFESGDTTFLDPAMAGGQMLKSLEDRLRQFGHSDENISKRVFGVSENPLHNGFARKKNNLVGHIFKQGELDDGMKFNLGLVNPPFSLGKKLLYPEFFEKGLEVCDQLIMVMPVKLDSLDRKLKSHNELIMKHQDHVSEDVSFHFSGINVGQISYVIASKSTKNVYSLPAERRLPRILPNRERLKVINGKSFDSVERGCVVVHKVHKDGIVYDKCNKAHRDNFRTYFKKHADLSLPWMVMINHTPSKGKFNCEVVKYSPDMVWSRWVYVVQAKTKKEANEIIDHLRSKPIVNYLTENMTSHTVSKTILQALPSHVG